VPSRGFGGAQRTTLHIRLLPYLMSRKLLSVEFSTDDAQYVGSQVCNVLLLTIEGDLVARLCVLC